MDINVQELKQKMDAGEKFAFIDVREPYEYEDFNLGAELIPLGNIAAALPKLEQYRDQEIVIHCRSGARSGRACDYLKQLGYKNPRNLEGGVLAWIDAYGK